MTPKALLLTLLWLSTVTCEFFSFSSHTEVKNEQNESQFILTEFDIIDNMSAFVKDKKSNESIDDELVSLEHPETIKSSSLNFSEITEFEKVPNVSKYFLFLILLL
jgi:hypothetical protein